MSYKYRKRQQCCPGKGNGYLGKAQDDSLSGEKAKDKQPGQGDVGWGGSLGSLERRSELILTQNAVRQNAPEVLAAFHENIKSLATRKNSFRNVLKLHSICLFYSKWVTFCAF